MTPETRSHLETLRFREKEPEGMIGRVEDVEFVFVSHPFKGLAMWVTHITPRTATQFEVFLPPEASLQELAGAISRAFEKCHPERAG